MISKEERLQYGEILREQMREKERRKQLEDLEKRGAPRMLQPYPQQYYPPQQVTYQPSQPQQQVVQPPPAYTLPPEPHYKENSYSQSPVLDKKEILQKKLEMQDYNPFGRGGSGAPMRDQRGEIITNRKPAAISQPSNSANYAQYEQVYAPPQQQQVYQQQQHYGSQQNIMQGAQHLDNQPYSPPPPSQQVPQVLTYSQPHQPQLQPIMEVYQPSFVQSPPPQHQPDEVYRAGGRNLLQMENVGIEEINLKQRQKMELQKVLQQQIDDAARRKKEAEEKERQLEFKREEDHRRYLEEEKRREYAEKRKKQIEEENRLAVLYRARQPVVDANNNKKRKNFVEMPPIQLQYSPQISSRPHPQSGPVPQYNYVVQRQQIPSPSPDLQQYEDNLDSIQDVEGAFNTEISRDFLRKEKYKHPYRRNRDRELEYIKNRIHNMQQELSNKNEMHNNYIEKVRLYADRARMEKQNTELELNRLKEELRRKIDEENERLHIALLKNDPSNYVPPSKIIAEPAKDYPPKPPTPLRDSGRDKLVEKTYRVQEENVNISNSSNNFDTGLQSLVAESRKIPVLLKNNDKLTMSRIEEFAVDSRFFHKKSTNNVVQKRNDVIYEAEEDENNNAVPQNFNSQYRPKSKKQDDLYANEFADGDELDKFVRNRAQPQQHGDIGKWSMNMSSVGSEMNKEIEVILKDQRRVPSRGHDNSERLPTKLSNAGKNIVSDKYGYGAENFTLNSELPGSINGAYGTQNSFNLERINKHSDRLLEKLDAFGSGAGNDNELGRLNIMLDNYPS